MAFGNRPSQGGLPAAADPPLVRPVDHFAAKVLNSLHDGRLASTIDTTTELTWR
jgi:hypothetical protein